MLSPIKRRQQSSDRILALQVCAIQRNDTAARAQYFRRRREQGVGFRIRQMMQDGKGHHDIERADIVYRFG
jgi:hypothetical protein